MVVQEQCADSASELNVYIEVTTFMRTAFDIYFCETVAMSHLFLFSSRAIRFSNSDL